MPAAKVAPQPALPAPFAKGPSWAAKLKRAVSSAIAVQSGAPLELIAQSLVHDPGAKHMTAAEYTAAHDLEREGRRRRVHG